jgi:hypothetical protein
VPPLSNPRHERFVQALFEGKSATDAYEQAGYKPDRKNAARLTTNDGVRARLTELQTAVAKNSAITIESICAELDAANAVAKERGQAAAMVSASALRAKLAGLMVERVEVGGPGSFDKCDTPEQVADALLDGWNSPVEQFRPVTDADRQELAQLLLRHNAEVQDFLASIKARPIAAVRVHDPQEARRRMGLPQQRYQSTFKLR